MDKQLVAQHRSALLNPPISRRYQVPLAGGGGAGSSLFLNKPVKVPVQKRQQSTEEGIAPVVVGGGDNKKNPIPETFEDIAPGSLVPPTYEGEQASTLVPPTFEGIGSAASGPRAGETVFLNMGDGAQGIAAPVPPRNIPARAAAVPSMKNGGMNFGVPPPSSGIGYDVGVDSGTLPIPNDTIDGGEAGPAISTNTRMPKSRKVPELLDTETDVAIAPTKQIASRSATNTVSAGTSDSLLSVESVNPSIAASSSRTSTVHSISRTNSRNYTDFLNDPADRLLGGAGRYVNTGNSTVFSSVASNDRMAALGARIDAHLGGIPAMSRSNAQYFSSGSAALPEAATAVTAEATTASLASELEILAL
jgi:hypothetical protein